MIDANDQSQTSASDDLSASTLAVKEAETQTAPETNTNTTLTPPTHNLNPRHYKECTVKRGLDPEWIALNVRSMNTKEATDRLGYKAKSEGMWLEGYNGFGQFKPDKPWKDKEDKKAPKYRTATKEEYDAMLPKHPTNKQYWTDYIALRELAWKINGHPCLLITEGLFKAIMACFHDMPCIALAGVEQGLTPSDKDPQGKRYLVETLELLARQGFGFIIVFDADSATNINVGLAQYKLAKQLEKFKVPVYISSGWDISLGKGMDDYIHSNGVDEFKREVMGKLIDLASWEKQFTDNQSPKRLSQRNFVNQFTEKYRPKMAWNVAAKSWYWYESQKKAGVWGEIPAEEAMDIVTCELDTLNCDYSCGFVEGALKLLKAKLRVNNWEVRPGFICLEDCVIDTETGKEYTHEPGYRFLSSLPYKWSERSAGCQLIKDWLLEICEGREAVVQVLRAGLKATVIETGNKLQRFIELLGFGGTGKGSILRLVTALVGKENVAITDLKQLESNRFETASFYGKKAVLITDSERYTGDVSNLKKLTGDDLIRFEKKGVQQTDKFVFKGMVWVASNEAIQSNDYTSGLKRRRLSLPFDKIVPVHLRRDLETEFTPFIAGLLSWVLDMPNGEMSAYIVDTERTVPALTAFNNEILLDTNPIAAWADECLVFESNARARVGNKGMDTSRYLFSNYCTWVENHGYKPIAQARFSRNLLDFLKSQLGRTDVLKQKDNIGAYIAGIALRSSWDETTPSLITSNGSKNTSDAIVTAVTPASDGSDASDGTFDKEANQENFDQQPPTNPTQKSNKGENSEQFQKVPSPPSNPSQAKVTTITGTVTTPNQTRHSPSVNTLNQAPNNKEGCKGEKNPSLAQLVTENWDNQAALGQIILKFADSIELDAYIATCTSEQIKHIKSAAKSAWRPNPNSFGEYRGEKCELMKYGNDKKWQVRLVSGTEVINVSGNEVYPWLGF
jgi:putative DNA primase/helicase